MHAVYGIQGRLPQPVAGLLFALEGVLFDDTGWRRWALGVLGRLGVRTDNDAFRRRWDGRFLQAVCRGQRTLSDGFRRLLLSYSLTPAQVGELELACRAQWRDRQRNARPLPGVRRTLARLRDLGLVMGVLSDSDCTGEEIGRRLDECGLGDTFTSVISSLDTGQTKPEPIGYARSARAMGIEPREAAFVGHRTEELAGAAAAGMGTIAFNYDADARADVYLGRIDQLLELFDNRNQYAAAG
jgi:HAD superfamily hydrolase (TIGR01509 family)